MTTLDTAHDNNGLRVNLYFRIEIRRIIALREIKSNVRFKIEYGKKPKE